MIEERIKVAENILSRIRLSPHEADVLSLGLVSRLRLSRDGKRIAVFIDPGMEPRCSLVRIASEAVLESAAREIKRALSQEFEEVLVIDEESGRELA